VPVIGKAAQDEQPQHPKRSTHPSPSGSPCAGYWQGCARRAATASKTDKATHPSPSGSPCAGCWQGCARRAAIASKIDKVPQAQQPQASDAC